MDSDNQTQLIPYQPFWCEENIWQLARHPAPGPGERLVIVVTGVEAEVACWHQRAGRSRQPLCWDYHVVLGVRTNGWSIWDLDTRLGYPVPARSWLDATFPCPEQVNPAFQPRFAVYPAAQWIDGFGSDRSHMRTAEGGWQHEPPAWPPISGSALTLGAAVASARAGLDLAGLCQLFSAS